MNPVRRIGIHAVSLLLIFQVFRILFWLSNRSQFIDSNNFDLVEAFAFGLRFDLATLALSNGWIYLLCLLPWPTFLIVPMERCLWILATAINGFFVTLNIVDIEYFKFTGKRFTRDSFAIGQDLSQQFFQVASYYWLHSLLILGLWFAIFAVSKRYLRLDAWSKISPIKRTFAVFGSLCLLALAARGGWQAKPLIPAHAFAETGPKLGVLTLNSAFTLLKSSDKESLPEKNFFTETELRALIQTHQAVKPERPAIRPPKNVVLVILESFGKEYIFPPDQRPSFTPFLQSLCKKGSFFPYAFANGRRSIDALPSIMASIPAWMDPPFITSPYQTNAIVGLAEVLSKKGLQTRFYHGGNNGTMFFDVLAQRLGFDAYIGASEYPHAGDYDGQWGIFDEPFLQFVVDDLSSHAPGFFAGVFTLSSHHPYRIPDALKGRFPKGTLEIHESLGYADYALQKFYEKAKQQPWFADTLFIFTADHTSKTESPLYESSYGRFAVPLLFIQNDQPVLLANQDSPVQHADILPTVVDILDLPMPPHAPFGQSLLYPLTRPGIVLYEGPSYKLLTPSQLISTDFQGVPDIFDWRKDPLLLSKLKPESTPNLDTQLNYLKAEVQAYNNGLVRNRLLW